MHSINLRRREDDKEEQSCNPSPFIDMSGICDDVLIHKEGGSSPQINTFFNVLPLGISPHKGGNAYSVLSNKRRTSLLRHMKKVKI